METKETGTKLKCRHCKYEWTYTGGANRTNCPNCEQHVNVIKDLIDDRDPFDPMNTPYKPGMTKEEIFDIMVEKIIRKGETLTPQMKSIMETLAKRVAEYGNDKYGGKQYGKDDEESGNK